MKPVRNGAVGIFDSGVGGLSVLRHVRAALPDEHLVYLADAGYAPYGDKPEALIVERSLAIAAFLIDGGAKALVVACNTATAAAIDAIRLHHPAIAVVGVEPGLKPAADLTKSKIVGVLATSGTLASLRFAALQRQIAAATGVRFLLQPCPGLADQIEKGELRSPATARLVEALVRPLLAQDADTLVLGCTHYPFVLPLIEAAVSRHGSHGAAAAAGYAGSAGSAGHIDIKTAVTLIDTGGAVARQLAAVLQTRSLTNTDGLPGTLTALTTGSRSNLQQALLRLLALSMPVSQLVLENGGSPAADGVPEAGLPF